MRRKLVAGNWKMNLDHAGARELTEGVAAGVRANDATQHVDVAVCPPALYVSAVVAAAGDALGVGVQNLYHEAKGAFTGEISAAMARDCGATYAILGHSERRHTIGHHEDDRMINLKVRAAAGAGLIPILCVGETLAERDAEQTLDVLTFQIFGGLSGVELADPSKLVIAYEPVWAIGTGRTATPEQAQEAHAHIRRELRHMYADGADGIRILYGGSMKPDNAGDLMAQPDVDGGLIGGASLKADAFLGIVSAGLASA